jgi:pantoate--beta-alanine ligase
MQTVEAIPALREAVAAWRAAGESVALVPTMGNLHQGHLRLVFEAKKLAKRVVASIFVNPAQFGAGEDFAAYPRTPAHDIELLRAQGTDLVFMPPSGVMYPIPPQAMSFVEVPGLSKELCGAFRPGHFRGVATVVCKLFNLVRPDVAVFGEKDYQQLAVIRRMAADLDFPIHVQGVPTVREADGLAMSSRNAYLTPAERSLAPNLYRTLCDAASAIRRGELDFRALEERHFRILRNYGFRPDYFSIRRSGDLEVAEKDHTSLVILAAAWLGKTRLIDNVNLETGKN